MPDSGGSSTEFLVDADTSDLPDDLPLEQLFSYGTTRLCRMAHEGTASCPCELIGQFGCPIDRYFAEDGALTVAFHAADFEQLRELVGDLRARYPSMDLRRLVRSQANRSPRDVVFVDRGKLTARQLEVLQTAYERGYFDRPRRANAHEVSGELGISPSTFAEHLAAAQTKLLEDVFEDGA